MEQKIHTVIKTQVLQPRCQVGHSPVSVFSCSVSVSVRLELARLDRQELRPDRELRPQSRTGCSGDSTVSASMSASELVPME